MIYLSFDQDWAPDWATRDLVELLVTSGMKGTFFATHPCPTLRLMRDRGVLEIGWHPNFLPGSSHGNTVEEVIATLKGWVPEASGVRAHCLIQGTTCWPMLHMVFDTKPPISGMGRQDWSHS